MTNLREESVRKLPVFDGLFDKNAEDAGLPEGLLARLRLFWMVRIGPRLAEIRCPQQTLIKAESILEQITNT
jgi:hypothetical protein